LPTSNPAKLQPNVAKNLPPTAPCPTSPPLDAPGPARSQKTPSVPSQVAYQAPTSDPQDRQFFKPLPNAQAEQVAQRLYVEVRHLSQCNARRLVQDFGAELVTKIWRQVQNHPHYAKIVNPAGYLVKSVEGVATQQRTTVNPPEFHGQSYQFHDWHPEKPMINCQCQYCAKTVTTKTPLDFCSPECEKLAHADYRVFSPEFGEWDYAIVEAPTQGWRLATEKVVAFEGFPHLSVRVGLSLSGQFEYEVILLPDVEPSISPRPQAHPPGPPRLVEPRLSAQIVCPLTGERAYATHQGSIQRPHPDGSLGYFWRYQVYLSASKRWYHLAIPQGDDIGSPAQFFEV
jgi:hypothetical protein